MSTKKLPPGDRTQQIYDGRWYKTGAAYYHVCCTPHCALTHYVEFKMEEGQLFMRWTTDSRETERQRELAKANKTRHSRRSRKSM